jgi:hypothetical protein
MTAAKAIFAVLAAKVQHDVERGSHSELGSIVERAIFEI